MLYRICSERKRWDGLGVCVGVRVHRALRQYTEYRFNTEFAMPDVIQYNNLLN